MEIIHPPGRQVHTVVKKIEENAKGEMVPGRIVLSKEQVFDAIDGWHQGNNHMGQERTWTYCRQKYYNISQALVDHYSKTCIVCLKKNPVIEPVNGNRKPIESLTFRERFQFDLIDFHKIRKRGPFGVLM